MSRVRLKFGSGGAEIGLAHHGISFDDGATWIGVDFGLRPREVMANPDDSPDFSFPAPVHSFMRHHLLTHGHLDHVGGLPRLAKTYLERGITDFWFYMSEVALQTA